MRKLKLYLDTSVIGVLDDSDTPDRQADTHALWEQIKADEYDVYLSQTVLDEINRCHPDKLATLLKYLSEIKFTLLEVDGEIERIAQTFIDNGVLKQKNLDDCYHVAYSMKYDCDAIVSWNFKHIFNIKTIRGVKIVSGLTGYPEVAIYSPTILIGGD